MLYSQTLLWTYIFQYVDEFSSLSSPTSYVSEPKAFQGIRNRLLEKLCSNTPNRKQIRDVCISDILQQNNTRVLIIHDDSGIHTGSKIGMATTLYAIKTIEFS